MAERGLTYRQLAALAGLDSALLHRLVNGEREAKATHIDKIASSLGVTPQELVKPPVPEAA